MKNTTSINLIILVILLICTASRCQEEQTFEDCYKDRKTEASISNVQGKIVQLGASQFLIETVNQKAIQRYSPCNLADKYKVNDKQIMFSGKVKEVYPHERWAGLPFVITNCKEL